MKVSIITVVFNNVLTLKDAIDSVLSQTYKNIEYIIIDGGSNDGTLDLISSYGDRVSIILSEPDKGIYDAMNKGVKLAKGEIIGILNSDDIYQDNRVIEDVVSEFLLDNRLDILYGDLIYVKQFNTTKVVRRWKSMTYYDKYFEDGNVPPHPTVFLRSSVYEIAGYFNLKLRLAADYEFLFRLFKFNQFRSKYINRLMVRMRLGGATNKNFRNIIAGNKEILYSWKSNGLKPPYFLFTKRLFKRCFQFFD
jgi:glycosyltransferase involved in cell wall biosynthesis